MESVVRKLLGVGELIRTTGRAQETALHRGAAGVFDHTIGYAKM